VFGACILFRAGIDFNSVNTPRPISKKGGKKTGIVDIFQEEDHLSRKTMAATELGNIIHGRAIWNPQEEDFPLKSLPAGPETKEYV